MKGMGMFGPDPYEAQMAEEANALSEIQAIDSGGPSVGVGILANRGAGRIRDSLGFENPALARGNKMKSIVEKLRQMGVDMNNPEEFYPLFIKELTAAGMNNEAMAMSDKFRNDSLETGLKQAQTTKYNAEAYKAAAEKQPELVRLQRALKEAKARGDTEAIEQLTNQIIKLSTPDVQEMEEGTEDGTMRRKSLYRKDGTLIRRGNPYQPKAATEVNINDKEGSKTFAAINEKGATKLADDMRAVSELTPTLTEMDNLFKSGKYNQGLLAPVKTTLQRALMATGLHTPEAAKALEDTELLKAYVMDLVLPKMKLLGGSDSNEELRKIEESVAQVGMTPEAAKKLMEIYKRKSRRVAKKYGKIFKGGMKATDFASTLIDFSDFSDVDTEIDEEDMAESGGAVPSSARPAQPRPAPATGSFYSGGKFDLEAYDREMQAAGVPPERRRKYLERARAINEGKR